MASNSKFCAGLALLFALFQPARAGGTWSNEPIGATVLLDCPFNAKPTASRDASGCGIENFYNAGAIVADATAPQSPSNVYKSWLAAGQKTGGTQLNYLMQPVVREMYVGLMWRTNSEFQGRGGGNKLFFIRGPDSIGVFVIQGGLAGGSGPLVWVHNSSALDNSHVCAADLGLLCYPNIGSGIVQRGIWTKIEAYIRASTTNTSRDGIVRWWINGVLAGNYTNINYAGAGLNEWIWTETWDGCGGRPGCDLGTVNTANWEHYIDHLHISARAEGGTIPPPPPPPPPALASPGSVTNLAVSQIGANSLTLSFSQVDDGAGAAAKYDVRAAAPGQLWGGGTSVSQGTCASPLQGTGTSGTLTCTVTGLQASTPYEFQLIAFRGTMNQGATYGGLSNVASATTAAAAGAATDVNGDGSTNITDVQLGINQVLGIAACAAADVNKDGICSVVDVQLIVNKALGT